MLNHGILPSRRNDEICANRPLPSSLLLKGPRTPGEDHPDVAITYNNLGNVHESQGDYPKALEYYGDALGIWLKALGEGRGYACDFRSHECIGCLAHSMFWSMMIIISVGRNMLSASSK